MVPISRRLASTLCLLSLLVGTSLAFPAPEPSVQLLVRAPTPEAAEALREAYGLVRVVDASTQALLVPVSHVALLVRTGHFVEPDVGRFPMQEREPHPESPVAEALDAQRLCVGALRDCGVPLDATGWAVQMMYNDSSISSTSGGDGIDVAIVDTGALKDHMDLRRRVASCLNFTTPTPVSGDCVDEYSHGTVSASIVAADAGADGLGMWGVAPGARLHVLKVCSTALSGEQCPVSAIAAALNWSKDNGVEVVSISLGGPENSTIERDAVRAFVQAGGLVVASAGNAGPGLDTIRYPAAHADVVAVGAFDSSRVVPTWSSRGDSARCCDATILDREVEVAAPGVSVPAIKGNGLYGERSGTSFAAPQVAGLAAKLWSTDGATTRALLVGKAQLHDVTVCAGSGSAHCTSGFDVASGFGAPAVS